MLHKALLFIMALNHASHTVLWHIVILDPYPLFHDFTTDLLYTDFDSLWELSQQVHFHLHLAQLGLV